MGFKKAKCDGQFSKKINDTDTVHYFDDGMVFAEIVVNQGGENVDSPHNTFKLGSKPAIDLTKLLQAN